MVAMSNYLPASEGGMQRPNSLASLDLKGTDGARSDTTPSPIPCITTTDWTQFEIFKPIMDHDTNANEKLLAKGDSHETVPVPKLPPNQGSIEGQRNTFGSHECLSVNNRNADYRYTTSEKNSTSNESLSDEESKENTRVKIASSCSFDRQRLDGSSPVDSFFEESGDSFLANFASLVKEIGEENGEGK